jgi:clan AA aspartic protease (TIGR02281 family)
MNLIPKKYLSCSFLFFALFPVVSWATVYKCVDEGRVVYSSSPCGADARMVSNMPPEQDANYKLILTRNKTGRYAGIGLVEDVPVAYVVDTGASKTAISNRVAISARITDCQSSGLNHTANGLTSSCVTHADIQFGSFKLRNQALTVLPNMDDDMLIGMDILQALKVEQKSGIMELSIQR